MIVSLIAQWLDDVDIATAPERISAMLERNATAQKDSEVLLPPMMQRRRAEDDEALARLALHEAAHSVIAHAVGLRVGRCLIRSDGGSAEYTAEELRPDTNLALLTASLAGPAWELLAGAMHPWGLKRLSRGADILNARLHLDELPREWGVTSRAAATLAVCSVESSWEAIGRVATALLNSPSGELDGARVAALCWGGAKEAPA